VNGCVHTGGGILSYSILPRKGEFSSLKQPWIPDHRWRGVRNDEGFLGAKQVLTGPPRLNSHTSSAKFQTLSPYC